MNYICWNVRGLGNPIKRRIVMELLRNNYYNITFLVETKLRKLSSREIKDFSPNPHFRYVLKGGRGALGGS